MNKAARLIDHDSLLRLAKLVNGAWEYFGAEGMGVELRTSFNAFFVTSCGSITVWSDVEYLDFTGEEDTYSGLSVEDGALHLREARSTGSFFYFHAGESVVDVLVLRERIQEVCDGVTTWEFTTDLAVVFVLSEGVIAVSKRSQHAEVIAVTHAGSLEQLAIAEPSSSWVEQIGVDYVHSREFIRVAELLALQGGDEQQI